MALPHPERLPLAEGEDEAEPQEDTDSVALPEPVWEGLPVLVTLDEGVTELLPQGEGEAEPDSEPLALGLPVPLWVRVALPEPLWDDDTLPLWVAQPLAVTERLPVPQGDAVPEGVPTAEAVLLAH